MFIHYKENKGFTLLELVVTIAITGIISVIVLPNIGNTVTDVNLELVTGKLMDDIRYTQNFAVTNHCNTWFTVNVDSNYYSYGFYATSPNIDPQLLTDPATNRPAIINLYNYNNISLTSETLNGGIDFNWFGFPTNGGQIVINNAKFVNIENETGYVYKN